MKEGNEVEYLDYYDEEGNYQGKETRDVVHRDALWHNTVHCWLYDKEGHIYFQIRKDEGTYYTTASGHIKSGETIKEGFKREIKEEIGIDVDIDGCTLVDVVKFKMDKMKNGKPFRDRAFANVYVCDFESDIDELNFDPEEVLGLVKVNAKEALELFEKNSGEINATVITNQEGKNTSKECTVPFENFLINAGETALGKYGDVLKKVIELTDVR